MPTINSPITNKNYQNNSTMREFVIPDGPDEMQEDMQYHQQMTNPFPPSPPQNMGQQSVPYQAAMQNRKSVNQNTKISDSGRKRVELLCGMSTLTRDVSIDNNVFTLRTLKSKENRNCLTRSLKYDGTVEFTFELRKQILATSVVSVSGIELSEFLGTYEFDARLEFIDELDDFIVDKLYSEYLALNKEMKDKYGINSDNGAKELVEDIKKS